MTNKQTTPLWRELNEKRTQGNWEVASIEPGDEYSLNVLAPINMAGDKRTVVMANPNLYFMDRAEQNAQYTALAVNNLASLAEALEGLLFKIDTKYEERPTSTGANVMHKLKCDVEYQKAKEALAAIS